MGIYNTQTNPYVCIWFVLHLTVWSTPQITSNLIVKIHNAIKLLMNSVNETRYLLLLLLLCQLVVGLGWVGALAPPTDMHIRLTGSSELSLQSVSVRISAGVCPSVWPCDEPRTWAGKTQPPPQGGWDRLQWTCDSEHRSSADQMAWGQSRDSPSVPAVLLARKEIGKKKNQWIVERTAVRLPRARCHVTKITKLRLRILSNISRARELEEWHFCFEQVCQRKKKKKAV